MDFMAITSRMLSLFIILAIGFIMRKVNLIDAEANARYTKLVLNITVPAQVLVAFVKNRGLIPNIAILSGFAMSLAAYAAYYVLALIYMKVMCIKQQQKGTYMFMSMFSNVGFMGYPVITSILGEQAMIYAVLLNVIFNVLVYSVGIAFINNGSPNKKEYHFQLKTLLNIPLVASMISIVLYFTPIVVPETIMTSLDYLAAVTTPVAMLVLGSTMAGMDTKELFGDWKVYVFTAFRLLILPLVGIVIFKFLPVGEPLMRSTIIVLTAMPVATNTTMLAIEYDGDIELSSKGIFFSTLLSVITIPCIAMLL